MIAKALGARVQRNAVKEIGWYDVDLTDAAASDAVFAGVDRKLRVLQWHGETFDLPEGATLLATSPACRNQAFRVGRSVYGIQFHCEVTPDMIADWSLEDANCGDVRELEGPIDPGLHVEHLKALTGTLFGRWLGLR